MDFYYFMAVFKDVVQNKVTDPRGRLTHLIKFTKGKAKEIAKNWIQLPSELRFKTVKRLLTKRFGDPHIITVSYRKEIKQWPQIKAGDAGGYRRFQNFSVKCENIDHLQSWNVLNTPDIICVLLSKLQMVKETNGPGRYRRFEEGAIESQKWLTLFSLSTTRL